MTTGRPLGDYLRARRQLILPKDAGLPGVTGRRRVEGLRRSEVALLAGISSEYYVKLEQGRETHPTDQVLDALSRALQLDSTARDYLHSLARLPAQDAEPPAVLQHSHTRWLIDSWPLTAAIIHDPYCEIIAVNSLMRQLVPGYREGSNSLEALLVDPSIRELHGERWEGLTTRSVALLRMSAGLRPEDPRLQALVDRLMHSSERFRELWHRNDVLLVTEGVHHVTHSTLGPLSLQFVRLPLAGAEENSIFLYYAEPGTPTEDAFKRLAAEATSTEG
jgi:transcriptional regulator with XRE-family HTH domain